MPRDHHKHQHRDAERRRKLRQELRARGVPEAEVERIVGALRYRQLVERLGPERARQVVLKELPDLPTPDDTGFRPTRSDSLLTGAARATGETAAAVKRRRTIPKWQHRDFRSAS
jgi:hypothetical protein